jgi:hypothetical protein
MATFVAFEHRDVRHRHGDHHRIYEAITARKPWRAEVLMREHVAGIKASSAGDESLWREVGHENSAWPAKASYVLFTNMHSGLQAAVEPP